MEKRRRRAEKEEGIVDGAVGAPVGREEQHGHEGRRNDGDFMLGRT